MFRSSLSSSRGRSGSRRVLVASLVLASLTSSGVAPASAGDGPQRRPLGWSPADEPATRYIPPVDAPVTDPFRPPSSPYGPGNRGIEYATVPGTPVVAAAEGTVTFAGQVAGSLHVTVQHDDGVRTTASFLATAAVVAGVRVAQGQVIGTTAARLHVSARVGDVYIDPASLWGSAPPRVHLVPLDGGGPVRFGRPVR